MIYAGIGARATPQEALARMERIGERLAREGWLLRSGAATGADSAFERGADCAGGRKEIFIPWNGFERRRKNDHGIILAPALQKAPEAMAMAERFHPNWAGLSHGARLLQARNVHQILGAGLDCPVDLVICWTEQGMIRGGTGQALRVAKAVNIPVLNLGTRRLRDMDAESLVHMILRPAARGQDPDSPLASLCPTRDRSDGPSPCVQA
jgi:hypothetical protein